MIDFSENKKGNFHKAGHCFIKTFVFLFLGIAELIKSFWCRLTKRGLLAIARCNINVLAFQLYAHESQVNDSRVAIR